MKKILRGTDTAIGIDFLTCCGDTFTQLGYVFTSFSMDVWTDNKAAGKHYGLADIKTAANGEQYLLLTFLDTQHMNDGMLQYQVSFSVSSSEFDDGKYDKTLNGFLEMKLVSVDNAVVNPGVIFVGAWPPVDQAAKGVIYCVPTGNEIRTTYNGVNWIIIN